MQEPVESALVVPLDATEERSLLKALPVPEEARAAVAPAPEKAFDTESDDPWLFTVITQRPWTEGAVVPHVAVEAGVGSAIDPDVRPLARGVSDASGVLALPLPRRAVEAERDSGGRVWFRVASPGLQRRVSYPFLHTLREPHQLGLRVQEGCSLLGRLVDAGGSPLTGSVRAGRELDQEGGLKPQLREDAELDGWFQLHLEQPGMYQILADAGEAGSAALRDQVLACATPMQRLELTATGAGIVRGRIRDAFGAPEMALELLVVSAGIEHQSFVHHERAGALLLQGRGRPFATAVTDAEGCFEVRGLVEGLHLVRASEREKHGYPHLLTPVPIAADGKLLELRFARPQIVVRVQDARGEAWDGALGADPGEWAPLEQDPWPALLEVVVMSAVEEAHLVGLRDQLSGEEVRRWRGSVVGAGIAVFEVEGDRSYQVGLLGPDQPWLPVRVHVPGGERVEVVQKAEKRPIGELLLSCGYGVGDAPIAVRIEDPLTGTPLVHRTPYSDAKWPLRFPLPEGRYRVAVEGRASVGMCGLFTAARHGRFEADVRVVGGETIAVQATLPEGARLQVRLQGEVLESDQLATQRRFEGMGYVLDYHASVPDLVLFSEGMWPRRVHFRSKGHFGNELRPTLPIGTEATSELLPSGRFTLRARMPGGRVASAAVELVDGATTSATLSFH